MTDLLDDLVKRLGYLPDSHQLKGVDPASALSVSYCVILPGIDKKSTLVSMCASIGKQLLPKCKDIDLLCQSGWFIIVSYIECGVLYYKKQYTYTKGKKSKHPTYYLRIKDWEAVKQLWEMVDITKSATMPSMHQYPDWTSSVDPDGVKLVRKGHPSVKLSPDAQPIVFSAVNKLQSNGWRVNHDVFAVYQQCLKLKEGGPFKHTKEPDKNRRAGMLREAESIEMIALRYIGKVFYHKYTLDFR
jgi:hypothetical protein